MISSWVQPPRIFWDGICEKSPSVHVHIQIQLGSQVEVEERIDAYKEDQASQNDQYGVLQSEKKKNCCIA